MTSARLGSSQLLALVLGSAALGGLLGFTLAPKGVEASAPAPVGAVSLEAPAVISSQAQPVESMQLGQSDSTRAEAKADAPGPAQVSSARIAEAKAKLDIPAPKASEGGSGTIHGFVRDESRTPLGGVTMIAKRYGYRSLSVQKSESIGGGPPPQSSLDEALEAAATRWAEARSDRFVTTTAADGSYAFTNLPQGNFSISGYLEDWTIKAEDGSMATPGTMLNFTAAEVHSLTLDVRLPGGAQAESAIIECQLNQQPLRLEWSPAEPTIRVGATRFSMTALGDPIEQYGWSQEVASRLKSETQVINTEELGPGALVLQLEGRPGIHGTVTQEWPGSKGGSVMAVAVTDQASFDPDDVPEGAFNARVQSGEFALLDLEPGLYAVGVASNSWGNSKRMRSVHFVQLDNEVVELAFNIAAPSLADHIKVSCLDPLGRPISGVSFDRRAKSHGGGTSGGATPRQGPEGAYWFPDETLADWNLDHWPDDSSLTLTAKTKGYGSRILELESGVREYTLTLEEPHSLTVDISGYGERDPNQKLLIRVVNPNSDDSWGNTILTSFKGRGWEEGPRISTEGRVVFPTIAAGEWRVELVQNDSWSGRVFDSKDIKVSGQDLAVSLVLPQLFELSVLAPKLEPGTHMWLNAQEDDSPTWMSRGQETLDETHRATFRGLTAGTYRLQASGAAKPMEVTVPSGEVLFDPKLPNVLVIQINDEKGKLYTSGFRAGDKVTAIDGVPIDELPQNNSFYKKLTESAVEMTVLRGAETLSLTFGPLSEGSGAFIEMGGMLMPGYDE